MNVHNLNHKKSENQDSYKSLMLLDEISKGDPLSQRDLSKRLNIALGLVNSYIKNLISKGYITIASIPKNRYKYFLTPKGLAEKTRLTYKHLQNFTNLYKVARRDFQTLFCKLEEEKVKKVVFCGVDEVAEIAYLSLQEFAIELVAVVDTERQDKKFFNLTIRPLEDLKTLNYGRVIITSFLKEERFYSELLKIGVPVEKILLKA